MASTSAVAGHQAVDESTEGNINGAWRRQNGTTPNEDICKGKEPIANISNEHESNMNADFHEDDKVEAISQICDTCTQGNEEYTWEFIPKLGMEFQSPEDAFKFYTTYAWRMGFAIKKRYNNLCKKTGISTSAKFCCVKEGVRGVDRRDHKTRNPRPLTRCGCLAHLVVSRNKQNNMYEVSSFEPNHNHELMLPETVHMYASEYEIRKRAFLNKKRKIVTDDSSETLSQVPDKSAIRRKVNKTSEVVSEMVNICIPTDFLSREGIDTRIWPDAEKLLFPAAASRLRAFDIEHVVNQCVEYQLQGMQNALSIKAKLSDLINDCKNKMSNLSEEIRRQSIELQDVRNQSIKKDKEISDLKRKNEDLTEELLNTAASVAVKVKAKLAHEIYSGKVTRDDCKKILDDFLVNFGDLSDLGISAEHVNPNVTDSAVEKTIEKAVD